MTLTLARVTETFGTTSTGIRFRVVDTAATRAWGAPCWTRLLAKLDDYWIDLGDYEGLRSDGRTIAATVEARIGLSERRACSGPPAQEM